jgi:hypothetical protein
MNQQDAELFYKWIIAKFGDPLQAPDDQRSHDDPAGDPNPRRNDRTKQNQSARASD